MLKIDRQSWHYRLVRWAFSGDKSSAGYAVGYTFILPGWRRAYQEFPGGLFKEPKNLCAYLQLLLVVVIVLPALFIMLATAVNIAGVLWTLDRALGWLLLWPIRLLGARVTVPDKVATTWQVAAAGAKAIHTRSCPRIEYVGGEQKEGVA